MAKRRRTLPFTLFLHAGIEKKVRMMRYDLNALADFEQQCGMGIGQLLNMKAVFATTRAMVWVGAKHEDPTFTLEGAGDICQEYLEGEHGTIGDVLAACFEIATQQGAIGVKKKTDDDDDGGPDPNVLEGTVTASEPVPSAGSDGSKKPS